MSIELHLAAKREVAEAFAWYQARSATSAKNFLSRLDQVLQRIEERPEEGVHIPSPPGTELRRMLLNPFPYAVFYYIEPRLVAIAFAHTSRKPEYWTGRLII